MASRSVGYSWSFSAHQLNSIRTTFLDGISKWFLGEQVQPLSSMTSRRRLGLPLHSSAWFLSSQAELIGQRQDALGKWERLLGREGMKWIKSRRRQLTSAFQGVSINGGDGWVKQLCIKTIQNISLRSIKRHWSTFKQRIYMGKWRNLSISITAFLLCHPQVALVALVALVLGCFASRVFVQAEGQFWVWHMVWPWKVSWKIFEYVAEWLRIYEHVRI